MIQNRKHFHKCLARFCNYLHNMRDVLWNVHFLMPFLSSLLIMVFASIPQAPEQTFWFNFPYALTIYTLINLLAFFLLRKLYILNALSRLLEVLGQGRVLVSLILIVLYTKIHHPDQPQNAAITDALVLGLIVCLIVTACRDAVHFSRFVHKAPPTHKDTPNAHF